MDKRWISEALTTAQLSENPSRLAVNGSGVESVRTRAGFFSVGVLPPAPWPTRSGSGWRRRSAARKQHLEELELGEASLRAQLVERDRALAQAAEREAALADVMGAVVEGAERLAWDEVHGLRTLEDK